jgi:hypothetical protein
MKFFRQHNIRYFFLLMTGLTFLNMSFFLAEVSALKGAYSKNAMENIARLFTNSLSEEETDTAETTERVGSVKELDLLGAQIHHLNFEQSEIENILKIFGNEQSPQSGYFKIVTPPPDQFFIG